MYMTDRVIAKIIHQCWVSHQIAVSQPYNDRPTDAQRDSILAGYRHALHNPTITCEENHEAWKKYKSTHGWTFGPVRNDVLLQHPNMVPYSQLPEVEKTKDEVFLAACRLIGQLSDI